MAGEVHSPTAEELAARFPGIDQRMVVLPLALLEDNNPLVGYARVRLEDKAFNMELRRAGLGPDDVKVFELIIGL